MRKAAAEVIARVFEKDLVSGAKKFCQTHGARDGNTKRIEDICSGLEEPPSPRLTVSSLDTPFLRWYIRK